VPPQAHTCTSSITYKHTNESKHNLTHTLARAHARTHSFLVHEWCNSTLGEAMRSNLLHKDKQPLVDLILGLLLDVAMGTAYLHHKSIIHGDLK